MTLPYNAICLRIDLGRAHRVRSALLTKESNAYFRIQEIIGNINDKIHWTDPEHESMKWLSFRPRKEEEDSASRLASEAFFIEHEMKQLDNLYGPL
jgi:hypothetical protein